MQLSNEINLISHSPSVLHFKSPDRTFCGGRVDNDESHIWFVRALVTPHISNGHVLNIRFPEQLNYDGCQCQAVGETSHPHRCRQEREH